MNPVDVKSGTSIDFNRENNKDDAQFQVGNSVRLLSYKNIFEICYIPNWFEEVLQIKKVISTAPWLHVISDLNFKYIFATFYEK